MQVCPRPNCDREPTADGLGFCAEHHAHYLADRRGYAALANAVRILMPAVFAPLTEREAKRLAEFIVAHASDGVRGFSNERALRGEIIASFDAIAEARDEQGAAPRGLRRRPLMYRGEHNRFRIARRPS